MLSETITQIIAAQPGWRVIYADKEDGKYFHDPVACWALVSEDNGHGEVYHTIRAVADAGLDDCSLELVGRQTGNLVMLASPETTHATILSKVKTHQAKERESASQNVPHKERRQTND